MPAPRGTRYKAMRQGKQYYHGRPCLHCGATYRYTTTGHCVRCCRITAAKRSNSYNALIQQRVREVRAFLDRPVILPADHNKLYELYRQICNSVDGEGDSDNNLSNDLYDLTDHTE